MSSFVHSARHRLRPTAGESGLTLPEVLVAMVISVVILGAITTTMVFAERLQARTASDAVAQNDARAGLDEMVSQIRQAWNIVSAEPNAVVMDVDLDGSPYEVLYECDVPEPGTSDNECVRLQAAVGTQITTLQGAVPVITNLENGTTTGPVFGWAPSAIAPYYMTATVEVPASDGTTTDLGLGSTHTIALSDGALMRNENVGN